MTARLALLALALVACEGKREPRAESSASAAPAANGASSTAASVAPAPTAQAPGGACPHTGLWSDCTIFERLDRAGLAPQRDSAPASEPPLTIGGRTLRVGGSELELYVYRDAAAREREAKSLDRAKYVAYDAPLGMQPLPTLIQTANLVAILHTRNDHLRERVADALTAGPPQP